MSIQYRLIPLPGFYIVDAENNPVGARYLTKKEAEDALARVKKGKDK